VTINARALEHALRKMFTSPLAEVRAMGEEMRQVSSARLPTLIKYVERVTYHEDLARRMSEAAACLDSGTEAQDWCVLTPAGEEGEARVLAAGLYRYGSCSFASALAKVRGSTAQEKAELAERLLGGRGRFDMPPRELEYAGVSVDLILDQGGYFELKRHRMMSLSAQPLSTRLGYAIPRRLSAAGLEADYRRAMDAAAKMYEALAGEFPDVAGYIVPNGYNRRCLMEMNLRSAMHLCALRSAPNAHFSMRRVAQRLAEQIRAVYPILGGYLLPYAGETWQSVEAENFSAVQQPAQ